MAPKVKVLIVDDSAFMRSMLKRMIVADPRFEVIGLAENGREGVEKTMALKPDVVTMDVEMPVMTGLDALEQIMRQCPTPVIMVSTLTEQGARITLEALDKGAIDFLPKALKDSDKNVFKSAGVLHEKLLAASRVQLRKTTTVAPAPLPPVRSLVRSVKNAKLLLVGSSTGGPKALQSVIGGLPERLRVPVVVAQHMPAEFTKALAARLNETCEIRVVHAEDGMTLQAGCVYISPGGFHTRVVNTNGVATLKISSDKGESPYKPSVEVLGQSALELFGGHVVAVMLTGMGTDGAPSFKRLKDAGGHILVQDEATSVVYGMPRGVVELGGATEVFPLPNIAKRVAELLA